MGFRMRVGVFYHDRCFDGACSAAVFSDFYRRIIDPQAEFSYRGLVHRADQLFEESLFQGDENAIVDFKYCSSPKITWWFDHHQSAFLSEQDAEHFRKDRSDRKFYDPHYRSCTKFIANGASERFRYDASHLKELIRWADIIDGAQYANAQEAIEMKAAAMKLTLVFEASSENLTSRVIPLMASHSLEEIASLPDVKASFDELYQRHVESIEVIRQSATHHGKVVFFDLADTDMGGYNKFIPYYLFPESLYTVAVSDAGFRTKISVGSNPWAPTEPSRNLASICEHYGGGGHARVGAISYNPGELERARQTAREIVEELARNP
jgi:hypothetical protein